ESFPVAAKEPVVKEKKPVPAPRPKGKIGSVGHELESVLITAGSGKLPENVAVSIINTQLKKSHIFADISVSELVSTRRSDVESLIDRVSEACVPSMGTEAAKGIRKRLRRELLGEEENKKEVRAPAAAEKPLAQQTLNDFTLTLKNFNPMADFIVKQQAKVVEFPENPTRKDAEKLMNKVLGVLKLDPDQKHVLKRELMKVVNQYFPK
ncbi:unnamed protein product, partial [marine sediment metagenome]